MAEENKEQKIEKTETNTKNIEKAKEKGASSESKASESATEQKQNIKADNKEIPKKKNKKAKDEPKKNPKTEAIVNGKGLHISTKHSIAICNYIRNKNIDKAISMLEEVEQFNKAIPLRGEIPHRKGKGMMSGRYMTNAVKEFIKLLKSLKSNAIVNELELEKYVIFCKADLASRPYKRFGKGRTKRTNVLIKLVLPLKKVKKKIKK